MILTCNDDSFATKILAHLLPFVPQINEADDQC